MFKVFSLIDTITPKMVGNHRSMSGYYFHTLVKGLAEMKLFSFPKGCV